MSSTRTTGIANKARSAALSRFIAAHQDEWNTILADERTKAGLPAQPNTADPAARLARKITAAEERLAKLRAELNGTATTN